MKVSQVSIVKNLLGKEAIVAAINEMFNDKFSAQCIYDLVVTGSIGVSIEVDNGIKYTRTTTHYFITSELCGGFNRIEYCSKSKTVWSM